MLNQQSFPQVFFTECYHYMDMVCPYCRSKTRVVNSRTQARRYQVWRRRQCPNCRAITTSYEALAPESVIVVNLANGQRMPLTETAVNGPIYAALGSITEAGAAESLGKTCLAKIFNLGQAEIDQSDLERLIHQTLKPYDPRAALRYLADPQVSLDIADPA